jgi:hypothetical protein
MKTLVPSLTRHTPKVSGDDAGRVRAEAFSCAAGPRAREVFVNVTRDGQHVATVRVVVPGRSPRRRRRAP